MTLVKYAQVFCFSKCAYVVPLALWAMIPYPCEQFPVLIRIVVMYAISYYITLEDIVQDPALKSLLYDSGKSGRTHN